MTAVASPPNLESLPRLGWNSSENGGQGGLSAEDVSRMFVPKKTPQSTSSASSLPSTTSVSSKTPNPTVAIVDSKVQKEPPSAGEEKEGWGGPSKFSRGFWPQSKPAVINTSTTSAVVNGRSQANGTTLSNSAAAQTASALNQTTPLVPSQKMVQPPPQTNGVRTPVPPAAGSDPPALLVLLPMNGTFERKQINVPQFPEVLRIGRQTNAKTVPTPTNGYFDSKVLSRQHAEVWADRTGKIWIRDVKSSNGTFVNGMRLSPESRDSEPHELRENDVLELGIDIVSEDQKSIVHHKVSAKVEHAGIPTNAASVLDLNFGDIEPGSGGALSFLSQNLQARGRLGSQGSHGSNGRGPPYGIRANNLGGFGVQRHMGAWLNPVTIEQVVKRLAIELRQAKQQSQELNRAGDFVSALLHSEPGQELPKPPADLLPSVPVVNGTSPQRVEVLSPFSQPPAPPPQFPLPKKPDVARSMSSESGIALTSKRNDAEKIQLPNNLSPTRLDSPSSQLTSLMRDLTTARMETDSQRNRVRQLEEQLQQERRARESAEERARHLLDRSKVVFNGSDVAVAQDDAVSVASDDSHITTVQGPGEADDEIMKKPTSNIVELQKDTGKPDSSASTSKDRIDSLLKEMEQLRTQMKSYKDRAENAEKERETLADMVERIRHQGESKAKLCEGSLRKRRSSDMATHTELAPPRANGSANPVELAKHDDDRNTLHEANGIAENPRVKAKQLQSAITQALALHKDNRISQSAPYASMLGVLLIGVGLMTYLNGWQKLER